MRSEINYARFEPATSTADQCSVVVRRSKKPEHRCPNKVRPGRVTCNRHARMERFFA